jgi:hypothetical protein
MKKLLTLALILWIVQLVNAQAPTISSFTPSSGPVGTLVTITGTNLSSPSAFSVGGVSAIAVSNSGTSLVGMVMPGATTGAVSVTTAGGTATGGSNFAVTPTYYPEFQQGNKLVGTGNVGASSQGTAVAVSADGNTAIVGGPLDGAAWVYVRSGSTWTQQGSKLVGTGVVGNSNQGYSVALSADGNTALVGGYYDNGYTGAVWVYTRSGGVWTQQGNKLVGTGSIGTAYQGRSVALSADGNTAIVGGSSDNGYIGAVWVYTRSGGVWTQQGNKLVGTGAVSLAEQGSSVAVSADGNTLISGGISDNSLQGAAWIFTRSGSTWTQQGAKLVGTGSVGAPYQGYSVAISANGNTAAVGGYFDDGQKGAVWVFTRSGSTWSQQGSKLVGSGLLASSLQGTGVALSADGNTLMVGGASDNFSVGATWVYTRSGGIWTQQGNKLVGTGGIGSTSQGRSVALSSDGNTSIVGGSLDNSQIGAAWVFQAAPPDYTITNTGGNVIITDIAGNSETLTFDNPGAFINARFSVTGRTYSLNGGATTNLPYTFSSVGLNSVTINTNVGDDIINVSTFSPNLPSLTINGGVGNDIVNFNGDVTFLANANLDVDLQNDDPIPGDDVVNLALNTDLVLSGTGAATIKVSKNVFCLSSTIKSDNGNITIEANQQAVPTSGTFYGFRLASARVEINGSGVLTIKGKGGNTGGACQGIAIGGSSQVKGGSVGTTTLVGVGNSAGGNASGITQDAAAIIYTTGSHLSISGQGGNGTSAAGVAIGGEVRAGGTGDVDISGEGGNIVGSGNPGVSCGGASALIRAVGGDVTVTGIGKGSGGTSAGVNVSTGAQIYAGGTGNTLVQGTGGNGGNSKGVLLGSANTTITSSGGNVSVIGLGNTALTTTGDNYGVQLINGGKITAGGTGAVSVQGTAGTATGNQNFGVFLSGATTQITSGGGNVSVSGFGGGSGASTLNYGVYLVATDTKIDAGVNGTVTVNGTGGASNGDNNDGILLNGNNALITSNGGNVTVNGFGGGSPTASGGQDGVYLQSGGQIRAGGNGVTTVNGTGGTSALNSNMGVFVFNGGLISSNGGNVIVNGTGGTGSSDNTGVYVAGPGQITAGGMGDVSVTGVGTGSDSRGVIVMGIGTQIYSSGGDVNVTGTGGTVSFSNYGVDVFGVISAGGLGNVTVVGNGGASPSNVNIGVSVSGFGATITSEGGDIAVTGNGGGIGASENNYGVFLSGGNGVVGVGNGTVTVNGTGGPSTGVNNNGVVVNGALFITSAGGDIEVYGQKGPSSPFAKGVVLETRWRHHFHRHRG